MQREWGWQNAGDGDQAATLSGCGDGGRHDTREVWGVWLLQPGVGTLLTVSSAAPTSENYLAAKGRG